MLQQTPMQSLEECVVTAMDGTDPELFPFLPYILQDLWEFGTDPEIICTLIGKHCVNYPALKILDLGCGKGAVSIKIAMTYGCLCHGIDAVPEFISNARKRSVLNNVEHLCIFEVGDIREIVKFLPPYDVVILGSIGPVFGDYYEMLTALSGCLSSSGICIIDDGYIEDNSDYSHPLIRKREDIVRQVQKAGMNIEEEKIVSKEGIRKADDYIFNNLQKRCFDLIEKHPDKRDLFNNYIAKQREENDVLENKVVCSATVLKKSRKEFI
jgi:SAM-dependent methyltransferase